MALSLFAKVMPDVVVRLDGGEALGTSSTIKTSAAPDRLIVTWALLLMTISRIYPGLTWFVDAAPVTISGKVTVVVVADEGTYTKEPRPVT